MRLYPAIDIKDGKCVRLKQGKFDEMHVYSERPVEVAKYWQRAGASYIHLVDLDGALIGRGVNLEVIKQIVKSVQIPVQLGGGIRTMQDIETVLSTGVSRVIIGTKAATEPEFMEEAIEKYGAKRIVAGIDAKNGLVATQGWGEYSSVSALELGIKMKEIGVETVVYTDISKDGMLQGPNVTATRQLAEVTQLDVIASGGVSTMEDLENLHANGIQGVIIGKALYEVRIDLATAINVFERA